LTRLRLVDDVAGVLEEAILSGRMRPGDRLVETGIGAELGVSRTTVREALLMLERRGLVLSKPRRGTFVTRLSRKEAGDLCATRALLEAYALTSSFASIDASVIGRLEDHLAEMSSCVLPDDLPRLVQIDIAFHTHLIAGADSPRVRELWTSLNGQMSVLFLTSLEHLQASIADVVALHRDLLDAIGSGDLARALQATIDHYVGDQNDAGSGGPGARIGEIVAAVTHHCAPPAHDG
jgi:DNA-binding GntR family transcriptional regulator